MSVAAKVLRRLENAGRWRSPERPTPDRSSPERKVTPAVVVVRRRSAASARAIEEPAACEEASR